MTIGVSEIVAGSTRVDFYLTYTDENDNAIDLTGDDVVVTLQGTSESMPSLDLDVVGDVSDAAAGIAKFTAFGDEVKAADLDALPYADWTCRGKLVDQAGLIGWTPTFVIRFVQQPLGP